MDKQRLSIYLSIFPGSLYFPSRVFAGAAGVIRLISEKTGWKALELPVSRSLKTKKKISSSPFALDLGASLGGGLGKERSLLDSFR